MRAERSEKDPGLRRSFLQALHTSANWESSAALGKSCMGVFAAVALNPIQIAAINWAMDAGLVLHQVICQSHLLTLLSAATSECANGTGRYEIHDWLQVQYACNLPTLW